MPHITPFDKLLQEAEVIQQFAEITMSGEMDEAVARGNDLQVYMARTGAMLADAKYWLNTSRKSEAVKAIAKILKAGALSAGVQNAMIDGVCENEQRLVDTLDRLNRTCTHQLDWCRTIVSKGKAEMQTFGKNKEFN